MPNVPFNIPQLVQQILQSNPAVANNPRNKDMINTLLNGTDEERNTLANNLCQSYGVSPQDAAQQALQFFTQQPKR